MPSLSGNTAIDVAIGLAFVYLLFSVLCSAVQEAIAGLLDMRSATLEAGLRNMLEDNGKKDTGGAPIPVRPIQAPAAASGVTGVQPRELEPDNAADTRTIPLVDEILGHGLIRTTYTSSRLLFRRKRRGPSYIPSRSFATALLDVIAPSSGNDPIEEVRDAIATSTLIPKGTKSTLLALATGAVKDRDEFRGEIEHWFDSTMNRVSGWYKRKTQIILIVIGIALVPAINASTLKMADRMWKDDTVRAAVVAQAQAQATAKPTGQSLDGAANDVDKVVKVGIPMGWSGVAVPHGASGIGLSVAGWILTILAISLGAPFWFDTLSRLSRLRSSGKPETPLPAAGSGKANERILTPPQAPPA